MSDTNARLIQGEITFGSFMLQYDAFQNTNDEIDLQSISIMGWKMEGEKWSDDQLRKVYDAVNAALQEADLSVEQLIAEAHTARRLAKVFSGR